MKELIEKYFNGETSNREEQKIIMYFLSLDIDPELKKYQNYFIGLFQLKAEAKYGASKKELIRQCGLESSSADPKSHVIAGQARNDGWRLSMVKRIGIALAVAASIALLILFFPFWHKSDSFIVLCGNEYSNENQVEGALLASLEDVRFEKKQMFNGSNNDLINLKNLMI